MGAKAFFKRAAKVWQAVAPVRRQADKFVPIPGWELILAMVDDAIAAAEEKFTEPKAGPQKLEFAQDLILRALAKVEGQEVKDPAALAAAIQHLISYQVQMRKAFGGADE